MINWLLNHRYLATMCAVIALVVLVTPGRSVLAHAEPERANPAIDGVVETSPAVVDLWFTQEVAANGNRIAVTGPDGASVDRGETTIDLNDPRHTHVTVSLAPNLPPGLYTVNWVSVSEEDGDAAHGTFTFTIASGTPVASPVASPLATPRADATPTASAAIAGDDERYHWEVFGAGIGVGVIAGLFIYGFWRIVRPKSSV